MSCSKPSIKNVGSLSSIKTNATGKLLYPATVLSWLPGLSYRVSERISTWSSKEQEVQLGKDDRVTTKRVLEKGPYTSFSLKGFKKMQCSDVVNYLKKQHLGRLLFTAFCKNTQFYCFFCGASSCLEGDDTRHSWLAPSWLSEQLAKPSVVTITGRGIRVWGTSYNCDIADRCFSAHCAPGTFKSLETDSEDNLVLSNSAFALSRTVMSLKKHMSLMCHTYLNFFSE